MTAIAFHGTFHESISGNSFTSMSLTEVYDSDAMHDDATDPSRVTIQQTGWYVVLGGFVTAPKSSEREIRILVDGTTVYATNSTSQGATGGSEIGQNVLHALHLDAGQYLEIQTRYVASNTGDSIGSVTVIRIPDPAFIGSNSGFSAGVMSLTDDRDTGGWYDGSTPTRVTVDSSANYLYLGKASHSSSPASIIEVRKNGTKIQAGLAITASYAAIAGIASLSGGDYLELYLSEDSSDGQFIVVKLPDDLVMAEQSTGVSVSGFPGPQIGFDAEEVDTNGFHDNSTNNQRVTAPTASVYWVLGSVKLAAFTTMESYLNKNGTTISDSNVAVRSNETNVASVVTTHVESVSSGTWFAVQAHHDKAGSLTTDVDGTKLVMIDTANWTYLPDDPFIPQIYRVKRP